MKMKLSALAIAMLSSAGAFAQTNVTIYGNIDQAYTYSSSNKINGMSGKNTFSGIRDGGLAGSRFGFKGSEDLGNGLKAIFLMEYGKDADNDYNSSAFFSRQSYVGLTTSKYGSFTVGRQYNAASDVYGANSANSVSNVFPLNSLQGQNGSQLRSQGGNARQDNMLKYVSPTFSGFTVRADYAFGETGTTYDNASATATGSQLASTAKNAYQYSKLATNTNASVSDNGRYSLAGSYANGPLNIDLAYAGQSNVRTSYDAGATYNGQGKNINEWYIGGGYDFKVVKVLATYQQMKNNSDVVSDVTDQKLWSLGAIVPVGTAGNVRVEYANVGFDQGNNPGVKLDGHSAGWGIGYTHDLSKRTTLYTSVSQINHDSNVASVGSWVPGVATAGEKQSNFVAGIRHQF